MNDSEQYRRTLLAAFRAPNAKRRGDFCGLRLAINRNVFNPWLATSSFLLAHAVQQQSTYNQVIDVGTGSGLQALIAAQRGARVWATDILPSALTCAERNARDNGLMSQTTFLLGHGYCGMVESADLIVCNPPFFRDLPSNDIEHGLYDHNGALLETVIREAPGRLRANGSLLLAYSSLGDEARLRQLLAQSGAVAETVSTKQNPDGRFYVLRCSFPEAFST